MAIKKYIWVQFQKEGIHCYPEAAHREDLKDVSFLGYPHRHIFHFKVKIEVSDSNRELEFFQTKRLLENLYTSKVLELDYKSCEMMCEDLMGFLFQEFGISREYEVTVSEDGENGSTVVHQPT